MALLKGIRPVIIKNGDNVKISIWMDCVRFQYGTELNELLSLHRMDAAYLCNSFVHVMAC